MLLLDFLMGINFANDILIMQWFYWFVSYTDIYTDLYLFTQQSKYLHTFQNKLIVEYVQFIGKTNSNAVIVRIEFPIKFPSLLFFSAVFRIVFIDRSGRSEKQKNYVTSSKLKDEMSWNFFLRIFCNCSQRYSECNSTCSKRLHKMVFSSYCTIEKECCSHFFFILSSKGLSFCWPKYLKLSQFSSSKQNNSHYNAIHCTDVHQILKMQSILNFRWSLPIDNHLRCNSITLNKCVCAEHFLNK